MPITRTYARSFSGGEVSPEFWGQISDAKFQTGLATCRNFEVLPHGPARNRAGFGYVHTAKYSGTKKCRLIPFTFSTVQTMVLEVGDKYIRFHTQGATLLAPAAAAYDNAHAYSIGDLALSGGVTYYCVAATTGHAPPNATYWYALPATGEYEIPTPYLEADVFDLHFVQSADVLTIVHQNYAPMELRRYGATNWQLSTIQFAPTLSPPTGVSATAHTGTTPGAPTTMYYVVTAVSADGLTESYASSIVNCSNNLFDTGAYNTISWSAVTGAARYNVYRQSNGLYGYIGQTTTTSLVDNGGGNVVTPNIGQTPPIQDAVFAGAGDYPGAVSYFEQRRCFAGTINAPQTLWMTESGTESSMNYTLPTRDDNRVKFKVVAREADTIRHIVPLQQMLLLTQAGEWRVQSVNNDAITPSSVSVKPQSYVGANNVQPLIVNNNLVYAAARGGHVREMAYSWQAGGYVTGDLSLRAAHLFDGMTIVDSAFSKAPYPICWFVSSNGKLLGLTYVPEQQVGAWHWHDTQGTFEAITVVAEGDEDVLYAVVNRTINGATVRYIERKQSRLFATLADSFVVDAGLSYNGAPATVFSGLNHLEGATVSILADGAVMPQATVTGGTVTLSTPASKVTIGLPYDSDIQFLPMAFLELPGAGQGRPKNVNRVWLRVYLSSGIYAGPDFDNLVPVKQRTTEPYDSPPNLKTEEVEVALKPSWGDSGQVCIRQQDPLPLTILNYSAEVAIGG
jgi:hypothetical protein